MDRNKGGKLSTQEVPSPRFKGFDTNGDGFVTEEESKTRIVRSASGQDTEQREKDRHFHFPNARRTIGRTERKSPELVAHAAPQLKPGTHEDGQATQCMMGAGTRDGSAP
jgi:hypothetical protein